MVQKITLDKKGLPHPTKSYLEDQCFEVQFYETAPQLYCISTGVPQGSIMGITLALSLVYHQNAYRSMPLTATIAHDTAKVVTHKEPTILSQILKKEPNTE